METRRHTTRSDAGSIRIHDQTKEPLGGAVLLRNGYGDCVNHIHIGGRAPAGEDVPPLEPIEHLELVVHRAGASLSDADSRNGYATPLPPGRYRVHRSDGTAPAHWWFERVGETTPRSAYAVVRSRTRGWTLALLAAFTGRCEGEETKELAALAAGPGKAALQIYTAGRRVWPLECPPWSDVAWFSLVARSDGSIGIRADPE